MKIAIASGKGGTGKTTLATNLAMLLAENKDVVLADLDVEEPNSGLFIQGELKHQDDKFKMIPTWQEDICTLCGYCQKVCNFNAIIKLGKMIMLFPEMCHSCYACSELCPTDALPMKPVKMGQLHHFNSGRLDFVESKLDIGQEQAVPLIAQTIEYLDDHFNSDVVWLFDSPPGTSCPVIEATRHADFVILVTEPTPFGLHDLKLAVETMKEIKMHFAVVINRFGLGNNDVMEYCEENDIDVIAKIPNSRETAKVYSSGALIYKKLPEFRKEIEKVASYIENLEKNKKL